MIAVVHEKRQIKAGVKRQTKPLSHRKDSAMEIDMHPLNLHKANLELMLRILNLSQDFRHCGLEAACRYHEDVITKTRVELDRVSQQCEPETSFSLPTDIFMQLAGASMSGVMAMGAPLVAAQTAYAQGLQKAIQEWQAAVVQRALPGS